MFAYNAPRIWPSCTWDAIKQYVVSCVTRSNCVQNLRPA